MSFLCCGKKVLKYLQHNTLDVTIMLAEKGNSCQSHCYKNESNFLEYKKSYLICIHKLGCQAVICNTRLRSRYRLGPAGSKGASPPPFFRKIFGISIFLWK